MGRNTDRAENGRTKLPRQVYYYCLTILIAMEVVLAFSFIGYINIPPVSITTLHVVVLIAALFLGKEAGCLVGLTFGVTSVWKASVLPFVTANAAFSPFISPDPVGSIVTSILTRALFGFCAGLLFEFFCKYLPEWPAIICGTLLSTFLHSILVYTSMQIFFPQFGVTAMNAIYSMMKVNGIITYGVALAAVCGLYALLYQTKRGRKLVRLLHDPEILHERDRKVPAFMIFSLIFLLLSVSLVMYFISDITRVFTYYEVNLSPETGTLVTNMGMQFAAGTLGAFVIVMMIFIYAYRALNRATDRAELSKMAFFANISHDMRTPLNGITGCTNLALQTDDPTQKDAYLRKVEISSAVMLELVNDILDISKMENEMVRLHPETTSVRALFDRVITPVQALADSKGVLLQTDLANGPDGYARIDRINVQKILMNLLNNAVKFTPAGGFVLLKAESLQNQDGEFCRFTVKDSGIGISAEFLPHIYEPFVQENSHSSEKQGTGLGLAIVRKLVDLMQGTIEVHSTPGEGTDFTVLLPFPQAQAPQQLPEEKQADIGVLQGRRVLLCEDNEINTLIAKNMMEHAGLQVQCAANGEEGVQQFMASEEGTFAAVLMDLRMPVMDGYEAAAKIRSLDRTDAGTVPILALSAAAYEEDIHRCREMGMNGHISKPYEERILLGRLANAIADAMSAAH